MFFFFAGVKDDNMRCFEVKKNCSNSAVYWSGVDIVNMTSGILTDMPYYIDISLFS